jgi:hypothetical protein
MLELGESFRNVVGHRNVDIASLAVPVESESKIASWRVEKR